MIVWQGLGFLVLVIAVAWFVLIQVVTDAAFNDPKYFTNNAWPKIVAALLAGVTIYFVGLWLNRRPGRRYIDVETREEVEFGPRHTMFFIRMEYWGPLVVILTLVAVGIQQVKGD
jgi:hypothetical protein